MSATVPFSTTRTSKLSSANILLGLIFAAPVAALFLAFGISTRGEQGTVAQTVEQVASSQM
jgi:hypothetical protein